MVIFIYNQKSFVRRRLRHCRLRHKIHTIKTRSNNPPRFLQRKKIIRRGSSNELTFVARKTTFRTRKRFHNKQYTPKSKDQPFESERTHFYVRFNNGSIAMYRQTFIFFFLTKSQPFNKKPKQNYIKQSQQTIQNLSINNTLKTKHNKQTRKTI